MRIPDAAFVTSRAAAALIALILVQLVTAQSINMSPRIITVDFYQYWGVAAARRMSSRPLGTPYRDYREYHAVLNQYLGATRHPKLDALSRAASRPGFTATPFTYTLFAVFPADYMVAAARFHVLQVLVLLGGVILLGVVYRYPLFPALCLAFLLVLASGPVSSDLRVGNIGCIQFAGLSGCLILADRLRHAARKVLLGGLLLSLLTILALVKPNIAPAIGILAVHLWVVHGTRFVALSAMPAALAGTAALILPCLYFGSWAVWHEWYRFVFGGNPYALAQAPGEGNYSTTRLVASWLGIDIGTMTGVIAVVLVASLIAAAAGPAIRAAGASRALLPRVLLERVFGDPQIAMAIGVIWAIALPPLAWYHYYVIAVIPGLWLLKPSSGSWQVPLCGLAGLVLSLGLPNVVLIPFGWTAAVAVGAVLSWLPLWGGVLLRLHAPVHQAGEALTPPAPPPDPSHSPRGRRPRRPRNVAARS